MTILLSLLLVLSSPSVTAEPFFCDRGGSVLKYERRYVGTGEIEWRHTMKIVSVSGSSGTRRAMFTSEFRKDNGSVMYGGPVSLEADLENDGDVRMNVSGSYKSVVANIFHRDDIKAVDSYSVLPSDMSAGESLPDASSVLTAGALKYSVNITARRVLRTERITTPAGTFDCVVVSEHKEEMGPGRNRTTTSLTWLSRGVGIVRHDTYDKNMKIETSEVLVSMSRP